MYCAAFIYGQGEQLNMTVFFWYLVKSNLFSVQFTLLFMFFQGTRNTQPCKMVTGQWSLFNSQFRLLSKSRSIYYIPPKMLRLESSIFFIKIRPIYYICIHFIIPNILLFNCSDLIVSNCI